MNGQGARITAMICQMHSVKWDGINAILLNHRFTYWTRSFRCRFSEPCRTIPCQKQATPTFVLLRMPSVFLVLSGRIWPGYGDSLEKVRLIPVLKNGIRSG